MDPELLHAVRNGQRAVLVPAVGFLFLVAIGLAVVYFNRDLPFNSAMWKNERRLRPRMVDNLVDSQLLIGSKPDDVIRLLGKPGLGGRSQRRGKYVYWCGTDGGIDDMWLEVEFDKGLAVSIRLVPD